MNQRPRRTAHHDPKRPLNKKLAGPTAVYRLFDADDNLLYVGISAKPEQRLKQHRSDKYWWHWVARNEIVWCPDRGAALQMEADIEYEERPRFCDVDLMGNGSLCRNRKRHWDDQLEEEMAALQAKLREEILLGQYDDWSWSKRLGPYAARYNTSVSMFGGALIRALSNVRKERQGAEEAGNINTVVASQAPATESYWVDDLWV